MNLKETIKTSFQHILLHNGTSILNKTNNHEFVGLITSGDYIAAFTEGDQETELDFQISVLMEDTPRTGDILIINEVIYIVQQV
jgi:hypothetical protein